MPIRTFAALFIVAAPRDHRIELPTASPIGHGKDTFCQKFPKRPAFLKFVSAVQNPTHACTGRAPLLYCAPSSSLIASRFTPVNLGRCAAQNIMLARLKSYFVALLVAMVLTLIPAALWIDMVVPMEDNWNNWYWKGHPHPRPNYSLQNPPRLFSAEVAAFKTLALPPAYLHKFVRGVPTDYAVAWIKPYIETAGTPPLASTLQHFRWALPFWFVLSVGVLEATRWVRRRGASAA